MSNTSRTNIISDNTKERLKHFIRSFNPKKAEKHHNAKRILYKHKYLTLQEIVEELKENCNNNTCDDDDFKHINNIMNDIGNYKNKSLKHEHLRRVYSSVKGGKTVKQRKHKKGKTAKKQKRSS